MSFKAVWDVSSLHCYCLLPFPVTDLAFRTQPIGTWIMLALSKYSAEGMADASMGMTRRDSRQADDHSLT